jgi:hypothetical protein
MQKFLSVFAFWRSDSLLQITFVALAYCACPEAPASGDASALWYSMFKDVRIMAIVEAIGKLIRENNRWELNSMGS